MNFIVPQERNVYLTGTVDQPSIKQVTERIIAIAEHDILISKVYAAYGLSYNPNPIKLFIDSFGGSAYACFGLIGVMQNSKTDVHTIVTGSAFSAGMGVSIAGKKRFAYKTSHFCYHQISSGAFGEIATMQENLIQSKKLQKIWEAHFIRLTKITKKEVADIFTTKLDKYYNAQEAIAKGIIDEIL